MATDTTPRTPGSVGPAGRPPGRPPRTGRLPAPCATPRTRPLDARAPHPARSPAPPPSPPSGRASRPPARREPAAGSWPARSWAAPAAHPRAPFILLLVGLLGGALVCLLVISTTLAEGSYRITGLQQQNASLAKQEQLLTEQVAQAPRRSRSPRRPRQLGMRPNPNLQFINLKTGKIVPGHPSAADSADRRARVHPVTARLPAATSRPAAARRRSAARGGAATGAAIHGARPTARRSTAQGSTARRSTAQRSTARAADAARKAGGTHREPFGPENPVPARLRQAAAAAPAPAGA